MIRVGEIWEALPCLRLPCRAGDDMGKSGGWGMEKLTIAGGVVVLSSSWKGEDEGGGTSLVVVIIEPRWRQL
jgi:hypothetical protein